MTRWKESGLEEPATARQRITITRLSMALGNKGDNVEESTMTKGQAGYLIRKQLEELRRKRGRT